MIESLQSGVFSLARNLPGIHTLDLSGTRATDSGLTRLGEGCRALRKIDLRCLAISDAGLRKLAEGCQGLEEVDLCDCGNVTDAGVFSVARHCPGLHALELSGTQATHEGVARLREAYPALAASFEIYEDEINHPSAITILKL